MPEAPNEAQRLKHQVKRYILREVKRIARHFDHGRDQAIFRESWMGTASKMQ
jgi:hypothetical protein